MTAASAPADDVEEPLPHSALERAVLVAALLAAPLWVAAALAGAGGDAGARTVAVLVWTFASASLAVAELVVVMVAHALGHRWSLALVAVQLLVAAAVAAT